ncbi:MAG: serine/threonine-protein kinase [bacterium]|nr:serine/threonine-protein kinase [bacterium]
MSGTSSTDDRGSGSGARPRGGSGSSAPDWGSTRDFYTFAPETLAAELPEFEILRQVGKGSMGIVYEARAKATNERVALKVLPPSLTLTERALARFYREGRLMARVRHPEIVAFHDRGTRGRLHWFAMEFVDGVTLEERLAVGPLPVQQATAIVARVARALQFAHDRGVVHRDVKPGNIMLRTAPDGESPSATAEAASLRVAVTDFGLARETGTGSMTESGAIVGTPMYMAPEMVLGGSAQAGTLADIYSLGATLYALVTGQPPFDGPTGQSVLKAVLEADPTPATRLRRDLPRNVAAIIHKAMDRDPRRRYGSALEFAEDLERHLRGEPVLARLPGPGARIWRLARRRPLPTFLTAVVLVLALGGAWLLAERDRNASRQQLAEAERYLAVAATNVDERGNQRTATDRQDLLLSAVAAASAVIERGAHEPRAFFVRAQARFRLGDYAATIFDLDAAERAHGEATPDVLRLRIQALEALGDRASVRRLQRDLTNLLVIKPDVGTRALVAEHLLDLAEHANGQERTEALASARDVLGDATNDDDARVVVSRARIRELADDIDGALAAMRAARIRFEGDLYVHLEAARMFDRHGLFDESARERQMARLLQPEGPAPTPSTQVDVDGLGEFLGDVDRLMQALAPPPDGGAPQPGKATPSRDQGPTGSSNAPRHKAADPQRKRDG